MAWVRQSNVFGLYRFIVLLRRNADARVTHRDVEHLGGVGYIREFRLCNPAIYPAIEFIDPGYDPRDAPTKPSQPPSASYCIPSTQVATVILPSLLKSRLTRYRFGVPGHNRGWSPSSL